MCRSKPFPLFLIYTSNSPYFFTGRKQRPSGIGTATTSSSKKLQFFDRLTLRISGRISTGRCKFLTAEIKSTGAHNFDFVRKFSQNGVFSPTLCIFGTTKTADLSTISRQPPSSSLRWLKHHYEKDFALQCYDIMLCDMLMRIVQVLAWRLKYYY